MYAVTRRVVINLCQYLQGRYPLQTRQLRACHVCASRRESSGHGNRPRPNSSTQGPSRRSVKAPAPPTQQSTSELEHVEVPSAGWMWQASSSSGQAGADSTASARPMRSAVSTVANLYEDRIKAKKSLGQNFVTDDSVLLNIVSAAGVGPGDLVLEVGPGTGNLTKHLLARGARVTAVEKDDTLYGRLTEEYREVPELTLVHGDALRVGLEEIIQGMLQQERPPPSTPSPADNGTEPAAAGHGAATAAAATGSSTTPAPASSSFSGSTSHPSTSNPLSDVEGLVIRQASTRGAAAGEEAAIDIGGRSDDLVSSTSTSRSSNSSSSSAGGRQEGPTMGAARRGGGRSGARSKVKVVANLPYNITKELLTALLPLGDVISDLHIMIQHEAAVRLTERTPGGPEWRAANIRTLFYCKPKYRFRISRHKYNPAPGVDGALVTFSLLPPGSRPHMPSSEQAFLALVVKAFSERRKKMRNSLQPLYSSEQVEAALAACGLNIDARAQDLTLEQFVALSWQLHERQTQAGMLELLTEEVPAGAGGGAEQQESGRSGAEGGGSSGQENS